MKASLRWARGPCLGFVLAAGLSLAAMACAGSTDNAGDPGNRRLAALKAEPILRAAPPGSIWVVYEEDRSSEEPFSRYFTGAHVLAGYLSGVPMSEARQFYQQRALALGWSVVQNIPPRPPYQMESLVYRREILGWGGLLSIDLYYDRGEAHVDVSAPAAGTSDGRP